MAESRRRTRIVVSSWPSIIIKVPGLNACVSTDIQAHTQENTHWACTQACILKYSYPGSGPPRGKGTESLVLGAQLLVVLGWTMPLGSQERWE